MEPDVPLLSGAITGTRYQVIGPIPTQEYILEQLAEGAFREPLSAAKKGETFGWCSVHNLTDPPVDVVFTQYLAFALRTDVKRLPAALFRALLDKEMRKWMAGTGRERVPALVKKELREALELSLLARHLPSVSAVDVVWDTARGEVLFLSTSVKVNDRFRKLFSRSFGVDLRPLAPVRLGLQGSANIAATLAALDAAGGDMLFEGGAGRLGGVERRVEQLEEDVEHLEAPAPVGPTAIEDTALEPDEHPANRFLGREFLAWLWYRADTDYGHLDISGFGVDFWLDDDIQLDGRGEDPQRVRIRGGSPSTTREARAALAAGKVPERARLGFRVGEREYTLSLRGGPLDITGLRVPQVTKKGDVEAAVCERMYLYEEATAILGGLFGAFQTSRLHPSWPRLRETIRNWMAEPVEEDLSVTLTEGGRSVTLDSNTRTRITAALA
jgi:hypothetical protein